MYLSSIMSRIKLYPATRRIDNLTKNLSQSVSQLFHGPAPDGRAHPSTGSQSGSATPGLTQVPSTRSRGLLNCRKSCDSEVESLPADRVLVPCRFLPSVLLGREIACPGIRCGESYGEFRNNLACCVLLHSWFAPPPRPPRARQQHPFRFRTPFGLTKTSDSLGLLRERRVA